MYKTFISLSVSLYQIIAALFLVAEFFKYLLTQYNKYAFNFPLLKNLIFRFVKILITACANT